MRILAVTAFACAVTVDQVPQMEDNFVDVDIPDEEEDVDLDFFRGESEPVDDDLIQSLVDDVPNVEQEVVQMEDSLNQLEQEIGDELPEICENLGIKMRWGFFNKVSSWAKRKAAAAAAAARRAA